MFVYKLNSPKLVQIKVHKYRINWSKASRSKFQYSVKQFLKKFWEFDIVCEEMTIPGSILKCDLVNISKKIIIESNGEQHKEFNKFFHNNSRAEYLRQIKRDFKKLEWAERNKFAFIEIYPDDQLSEDWFWEKYGVVL